VKDKGSRRDRQERGDRPRRERTSNRERTSGPRKAEKGFRRLFINLGKADGFFPGEVMSFINRHVDGRQEVGHIDLLSKFSYIEVPERDARKVMDALDGTTYKGRSVRCNDADEGGRGGNSDRRASRDDRSSRNDKPKKYREDSYSRFEKRSKRHNEDFEPKSKAGKEDWKQFFRRDDRPLKGEIPDFSEEGWARRKPKK